MLIYKNCSCSWKNMDWYWTRSSIVSRLLSGKKNERSSATWTITSKKRWWHRILEIKILSTERIWALSILVWLEVEEHHGRRWRQQEKISILYWLVRIGKSLLPSFSGSFRTECWWSFIAGPCPDSGRFLRVYSSLWMRHQDTVFVNRITRYIFSCFSAPIAMSMSTSGSLDSTSLSRTLPTFHDFQEFDSIWDGILWLMVKNPIWRHHWRIEKIMNTRVWETQDCVGIVQWWDSSGEYWTWQLLIGDSGDEKCAAKSTNQEFWSQKRKVCKERRSQETGGQNSVNKEH